MEPADLPPDWPFLAQGRRIAIAPHRWWVVETGPPDATPETPTLLLLHGTGASGHSFRRLAPPLARHFRLLIPDLPGQGLSQSRAFQRMGLDAMAEDLWRLVDQLGPRPLAVIGHSAGAAIGLRMAELAPVPAVIGLNAALGGFDGLAALLFPALARGLSMAPFLARWAARSWGNPAAVDRLLAGTGSQIDVQGRAQYLRLVQDPDHVAGALAMMAGWRLSGLIERLPQIHARVWLIATEGDRAVPSRVSEAAARRIPGCELTILPRWGHLPHEEAEDGLSGLILPWLQALDPRI